MNALFVSLAIGVFIALVVWQIWLLFAGLPSENRQFMDRPPLGFRVIWPFIELWVHHFGRFVSEKKIKDTTLKLKRAGVEYTVSAVQFSASQFIAGILFFTIVMLIGISRDLNILSVALLIGVGGYFYPQLWLKELAQKRSSEIVRALPFYLDIITLSVESGSNLTGGMTQAVQKSADSPLRSEFSRVLRDIRAGRSRAEALRDLAERTGSLAIQNVVSSLIQAERTGSSLGPLLRAQSEQLRTERFQRAEKLAMEAPVKLLGPLMMFIFPCTFMVLIYLVLSKAIQGGIVSWGPLLWAYSWPG